MDTSVAGFDWDDGNEEKCGKHGVSLGEIENVFRGTVMVLPDADHSTETEERFRAIGKTREGRYVFLVFTLRERGGETFIRPTSARHMHRKEIADYEKENPAL